MPVYVDPKDGFPYWGNPSPQKAAAIPARQIAFMVEDTRVNQVPGGRVDEIPLIQKIRPRQAKAEGTGHSTLMEKGEYGTGLTERFMDYYKPKVRTP